MKLSVIVITRNAEPTIRRCLESAAWADELVVVDSGSTDATREIARALGARVTVTEDFPGHGPQKNRALAAACGEWVLSLDSDEWVTPELRAEIEAAIASPGGKVAFRMPRRSSFCGRFMRHSGWWPDYVTRVFRREAARFSEDHAHDRLIVNGAIGRLSQPILHEAITDLEQMIEKINLYSTRSARLFHEQGRRASLATALVHGGWAFVRTYFLRAGFLDGREGFMLAVANAEGAYYRYLKLMLLGEQSRRP
jgi:glycosyltransferase involved in cell wall biosynthesis